MAERGLVEPRPHAAPVGHDQEMRPSGASTRHISRSRCRVRRRLRGNEPPAAGRRNHRRGKAVIIDQDAVRGAIVRPAHGALAVRHQSAQPVRFAPKGAEIRGRITRARSGSSAVARASARGCDASAAAAPSDRVASRKTREDRQRRAAWTRRSCFFARQSDGFARHFKPSVPISPPFRSRNSLRHLAL